MVKHDDKKNDPKLNPSLFDWVGLFQIGRPVVMVWWTFERPGLTWEMRWVDDRTSHPTNCPSHHSGSLFGCRWDSFLISFRRSFIFVRIFDCRFLLSIEQQPRNNGWVYQTANLHNPCSCCSWFCRFCIFLNTPYRYPKVTSPGTLIQCLHFLFSSSSTTTTTMSCFQLFLPLFEILNWIELVIRVYLLEIIGFITIEHRVM